MKHELLCAAAVCVATTAACAPDDQATAFGEFEVSDSAGVRIAKNGTLPLTDPWQPDAPELEIGTVGGDPEYQLYRVSSAKRLPDGRLVVANAGSREIRIYSGEGEHLLSFGQSGDGPADFRYPTAVSVLDDGTLRVQDRGDLVHFTIDGEFIGRETLDRGALMEMVDGPFEGGSWVDGETYVVPEYDWDERPGPPTPGPLYRPQMTFIAVNIPTEETNTLGQFGGILQQYRDVGGGQVRSIVPPFAHSTTFRSGDGVFVVADNAVPEFHAYTSDGSHLIVRWREEPEDITPEEVSDWQERQLAMSWTDGQRPELRRGWSTMELPPYKAFYDQVVPTSDGAFWVTHSTGEATARLVRFGPNGRYDRELLVPYLYRVMDGGDDWVLVVARDELEVEYLRLYQWPPR